MHFSFGFS